MLRIFCLFNWHTYEIVKGSKRVCKHCAKRQTLLRVGSESRWEDV